MSKEKKQERSIEQLLEEALILYEKTPYKLPTNWCWVKLKAIADFGMGQTILSKDLRDEGIPVYSATEEDKLFGYINDDSNKIKLQNGDLVIPARGHSIGYVKYVEEKEACCTQTTMFCKLFDKEISKFIYYYMKAQKDSLFVYNGNAIPQITVSNITEKLAPLAPLEEQKRIVEVIEKQFAKLDEARNLMQKALDSFVDRISAILYKAFNGELTKEWRANKNLEWDHNFVDFLECIEDMQNGLSKRIGIEGSECIVLRLADLKENDISLIDSRTIKLTDKEIEKYQLRNDDIIMIRVNGSKDYVGRQILFNLNCCCAYCDHIIRIRYKNDVNPKYMMYFAQTKKYKEYILQNLVCSAGQNTISRKGLSKLQVALPSLEEQEEIVRILDSIYEKEDKSKELIDMLDKIDEMKKSILARAFRGELVTSKPDDEPAIELLRRIVNNK